MKQKRYFFRFREALPKEYQHAINMGCSATHRTLTNAKDLAQRTKMTQSSENKSVTFAGTSMDYDRISGLEITLAKIDNRLKNLTTSINSRFEAQDKRITNIENHLFRERNSPQGQYSHSQSPHGATSSNWAPRSQSGSYQQGYSSSSQSQHFNLNHSSGQRYDSQQSLRSPSTWRSGGGSNPQPEGYPEKVSLAIKQKGKNC